MGHKQVGLVLGCLLSVLLWSLGPIGGSDTITAMAAVAILMSVFWITEAIPLAATALIPLAVYPLMGISSSQAVAGQYMNSTVFLLIGGFMIALAMERWNLHKRIALRVLCFFGVRPKMLLLGFMTVTAGLSMWISNTATTLVMLPIALAILGRYENFLTAQQNSRLTVALLLSIAYSASIGGMMTLVGTAPNLVFSSVYERATGVSVGFSQWMLVAVPVGLVMLFLVAIVMIVIFLRGCPTPENLKDVIEQERIKLGVMRYEEKAVLMVFLMTAFLWVTRKGISIQGYSVQGWSDWLSLGGWVDDGSVAIAMALVLFFIPARTVSGEATTILDEKVFRQLPWPVVVLFGGGFALAFGFSESGLSAHLAGQLQGLKNMDIPVIVLAVTSIMTLLTELTSNTATTQLVLPILQSASVVLDIKPVFLMVPATLAASCAFMFPVATPPNAIVFGSGKVKVFEMVRVGFLVNVMAIGVITFLSLSGLLESSYG